MPAVQTTYNTTHTAWTVGQVANMEPVDIITMVAASGPIAFGVPVMQAAGGDNMCKPSAASSIYRGVAVLDPTLPPGNADTYLAGDNVAVMTRGCVPVLASVAVAVGDPVYYVPATGVWTNVATSNTLIPNAAWDTSTAAAGVALLRLKA